MPHPLSLRTATVAAVCLAALGSGALVVHGLELSAVAGHPLRHGQTVELTVGPAGSPSPSPPATVPPPTPRATVTTTATPAPTPADKNPPPAAPPTPAGRYPYPLDAGGTVASGALTVSPTRVSGASTAVTVRAGAGGWVPGQAIFVYVGQRYVLTLPGPGTTATFSVDPAALPAGPTTISGFQFPDNAPLRPVDGVGTATLTVTR